MTKRVLAGALPTPSSPQAPPASNLVAEWDAASGVSVTGSNVTAWADTSANNNDLGTAVGAPQYNATGLNSLPTILFDGVDDALSGSTLTNMPLTGTDRTVIAVIKYIDSSYGGVGYGGTTQNTQFTMSTYPNGGSPVLAVQGGDGSLGNDLVSNEPAPASEWLVHAAVLSSNSLTMYKNTNIVATSNHTFNTANTEILFGKEMGFASFLNIEVAYVQVYSEALPDPELVSLISGFMTTYGITPSPADTSPDQENYASVGNIALNSQSTSNYLTVQGIDAPSPIYAAGAEFQIDSNAWRTSSTLIEVGQTHRVRHTNSGSYSTGTTTTTTIGGITSQYTSTTIAQVGDFSPYKATTFETFVDGQIPYNAPDMSNIGGTVTPTIVVDTSDTSPGNTRGSCVKVTYPANQSGQSTQMEWTNSGGFGVDGDETWFRCWVKFESGFNVGTSTAEGIKFQRHEVTGGGTIYGPISISLEDGGPINYSTGGYTYIANNIQDNAGFAQGPSPHWDAAQWPSGGNYESQLRRLGSDHPTLYGSNGLLDNQWHHVESYVLWHRTASLARLRIWIDDIRVFDQSDETDWVDWAGWPKGTDLNVSYQNIETRSQLSDNQRTTNCKLHSYWAQDYPTTNRVLWTDSIVIARGDSPPTNTDAYGNKMIGMSYIV